MKDLLLDEQTHDLTLRGFDLALVEGRDRIAQHVKQRLLSFREDWYLDQTAGLPWLTEMLGKPVDLPRLESLLKAEIVGTPGILRLREFTIDFLSEERRLSVGFLADTQWGELQMTEVVP